MPADVVKSVKVTFSQSLPMGTRGTFTHEKEMWIAYPIEKDKRISALLNRLIGIHSRIARDMVEWINARPGDTDLIARVLERTATAQALHDELITERTEAQTS